MTDYWIWCPSVIQDDRGLYHMFASRWPRNLAFSPHWLTNSEVVRAMSSTPEGPYEFVEVVLPARGEKFWDGRMTHNPSIRQAPDGTWLLFYTGSTYRGEKPSVVRPIPAGDPGNMNEMPKTDPRVTDSHRNQCIGLATALSLEGPWIRRDEPVLRPRANKWDCLMTTNPAPCVLPDGRILLVYKSAETRGGLMHLGVAAAANYTEPFSRLSDSPILQFGNENDVEDPFIWHENGQFQMIMKDMEGGLGGEPRAGIHAHSADGIAWNVAEPPVAYSRKILWDDGSVTIQDFFERPSLLLDKAGHPTHLFAATASGSSNIGAVIRSWNMVVPLQ